MTHVSSSIAKNQSKQQEAVDTALKNLYTHLSEKIKEYMIRVDSLDHDSSSESKNSSRMEGTVQSTARATGGSSLSKLTHKITTMDSFIQEHASTDQAYQIVSFINSHLEEIKADKKRYYKSLLTTRGSMLGALLNHTVMKLLSAARQIKELDGLDTKTWQDGRWVTIPQQIDDFFNYMTYEVGTLMGVLEPKQYKTLA